MDAAQIVRALGGPTKLAALIQISRSAVSNWPNDGIPARHWPRIVRAAAQNEATRHITLDVLEHHRGRRATPTADAA